MKKIYDAILNREKTYHGIFHDVGIVLDQFTTAELIQHFIDINGDSILRTYVEEQIINGLINGDMSQAERGDQYKECFKWYQNNKELLKHYGHASQCFSAIDCELEEYERTKEVYKTITDASMEAYLHSDHPIGLTEITDFLVIGYKESHITLSDIEHANKYDVLSAVEDSDYNLIKEKALEI